MLPQHILEWNRTPRTAIFSEHGEFSYELLDDLSNRFAAYFLARGLSRGERISLLMGNDPMLVACYFGAFKVGAIANPLNNRLTPKELAFVINHAGSRGVVVSGDFVDVLNRTLPLLDRKPRILVLRSSDAIPFEADSESDVLSRSAMRATADEPNPGDGALLIYTSGTTGNPKGVVLTQHNIIKGAEIMVRGHAIRPTDRTVCVMPLFHTNALMGSHISHMLGGASIVLRKRFSASSHWHICRDFNATCFNSSPTILALLLEHEAQAPPASEIRLDYVKVSSAPTPVQLAERFEARFGKELLLEVFGLTETTIQCTMNPMRGLRKRGSIGQALAPQEVQVMNENGCPALPGQVGELAIRGETVMKEYFRDPESTKRTIRDGWLYSGDLARVDPDGYFFIVGRKKEMIVRGGEKISPLEVEEVAARHPAVREAAAVGLANHIWGEIVGLAVVRRLPLSEEALLEFCRAQLSPFKVPERIIFVDELPRNAVGKVTRNTVKGLFAEIEAGHT